MTVAPITNAAFVIANPQGEAIQGKKEWIASPCGFAMTNVQFRKWDDSVVWTI
jgi:hypothetical protein